jgi:Cu(I)/Ag(I) efflux system membrane fusion protein
MLKMKTKSILFSLLFAATAFAFLTNCSGKKEDAATESHEGHDEKEHASESAAPAEANKPQFQVDGKFQEQLASVFTSYVELKDAFVSSDAGKVKTEATETKEALGKVDMKLLSGAAHNDWMNYLSPIETSLIEIESSSDIETQRKSFSTLSDNMYKSLKAFGLGGKDAFYEYCPMAFNNEGAYWLSDKEEIRNPYFGDKMLTCGEVREKLN